MKIINLQLLRIRVGSFSAKDNSVVLEVSFDDGAVKQVFRNTVIDEPKEVAEAIYSELVRMEKNINVKFDGKTLSGAVNVVIENEEDSKKKLSVFLTDLKNKIFRVKSFKTSDGYLDLIREINKSELVL